MRVYRLVGSFSSFTGQFQLLIETHRFLYQDSFRDPSISIPESCFASGGAMENSNSEDICDVEPAGDVRMDGPASTSSSLGLSVHQMMGGGKAADVMLWRRCRVSFGIVVVATVSWLLIERSEISSLSICSNVLLLLVVLLFIRANYAVFRKRQFPTLPELVLSEEMINNAATSFRVKVNYMLLMAHDITLGKDFRLFFKVVIALWLLSVIGSFISFVTLMYIGIIISVTLPVVYDKFQDPLDRCAGMIQHSFSKHYKIVDESLQFRLPKTPPNDKDS